MNNFIDGTRNIIQNNFAYSIRAGLEKDFKFSFFSLFILIQKIDMKEYWWNLKEDVNTNYINIYIHSYTFFIYLPLFSLLAQRMT